MAKPLKEDDENELPLILTADERDGVMKELIKRIIQAMVDNPEQVEIIEAKGENVTVLELKVAKTDIGKVIGKQGRNAQAIRTILSAASAKAKKRTVLEILE
jgi:predicted RNA-binding protein YlqC (UPF0109 family)